MLAAAMVLLALQTIPSHAQEALSVNAERTVARLVRYDVKPEHLPAFRKSVARYVRHALTQKRNLLSEAYYEIENPDRLWLIERWQSNEGLHQAERHARWKLLEEKSRVWLQAPAETIYLDDLEPLTKAEWRRKPAKEDEPITIMLFVDSREGTEDNFRNLYHTAMPQFRSEPGVINYQFSQVKNNPAQFVTYEKFRSQAAFDYHLNFPPIQPIIDYLNTSIRAQPFQQGLHRLKAFAAPGLKGY